MCTIAYKPLPERQHAEVREDGASDGHGDHGDEGVPQEESEPGQEAEGHDAGDEGDTGRRRRRRGIGARMCVLWDM